MQIGVHIKLKCKFELVAQRQKKLVGEVEN